MMNFYSGAMAKHIERQAKCMQAAKTSPVVMTLAAIEDALYEAAYNVVTDIAMRNGHPIPLEDHKLSSWEETHIFPLRDSIVMESMLSIVNALTEGQSLLAEQYAMRCLPNVVSS